MTPLPLRAPQPDLGRWGPSAPALDGEGVQQPGELSRFGF